MKYLQKITMVLSILVILFGFYQLNHEQDIFAQSKANCCNIGGCKYSNSNLCISRSSIQLKKDGCAGGDYILTCKDCCDYNANDEVCDDPKNSCKDANGDCYGWCKINGVMQWVVDTSW